MTDGNRLPTPNRLKASTVASHMLKIVGLIDVASWHNKPAPERRWIVDGMIPEGSVSLIGGDGGVGKSILALQLLAACTLGKSWLGRVTRPCKAIGIFCEDDEDELHRRLEAVAKHYGANAADLSEHLTLFSRVGLDNLLVTWPDQFGKGETTEFFSQIHSTAIDCGAEFVLFDSLHDIFGGNENIRAHARNFVNELRVVALEMKGAVAFTAHPSKDGRATGSGESGSTAWNNTVRSRFYLTMPETDGDDDRQSDHRELTCKKSNYGPRGGKIRLHWESGVFVVDDAEVLGTVAAIKRGNIAKAFLACLDAALAQGRTLSAGRTASNFAPKIFAGMVQANGAKAEDLAAAMERLFASNEICIGTHGLDASRHPAKSIVRSESAENQQKGKSDHA